VPESAEAGSDQRFDDTARAVDDDLGPRLAEVVSAALGVGAVMARTVAQATTSQELPEAGDRPLQDIVRFGTTAAGNLLGLVVDGARAGVGTVPVGRRSKTADAAPAGPRVTAGSTLRVPLLVENTGPAPTHEVSFVAAAVDRLDVEPGDEPAGPSIDPGAVTFSPPTLVIGPRDFEKLTVRVATTEETDPGRYRVTVDGGDGWFSTVIVFDVVA